MAALRVMREQTQREESISYLSGVLLCVSAVLSLNCRKVRTFASALTLLRATLDRVPADAHARVDGDGAARRRAAGEHVEQRRLARARRAEDRERLARQSKAFNRHP